MGAGVGLFGGRDGIFEIENEGVGPAIARARKLAFGVRQGIEQERAQSHVTFRGRAARRDGPRAMADPTVSMVGPASLPLPITPESAFAIDIAPGRAGRFARPYSREPRR